MKKKISKKNKTSAGKKSFYNNERIVSEIVRKDVEKSYNIDTTNGTEAYYSNRYGWTLRKIIQ